MTDLTHLPPGTDPDRHARLRNRLLGSPDPVSSSTGTSAHATARAMVAKPQVTPPQLPDSAQVIALALRWAQRRGRRLTALPTLIRLQLDALCDAGDPTTHLVRDWLACRGPLDTAIMQAPDGATNKGGDHDAR